MSELTLEQEYCSTRNVGRGAAAWVRIKARREEWYVVEIGPENEDDSWAEVENMEPSGDVLDRLVDQHPAPSEWSEEWMN